jgi:hypothetical protein
MLTERQRRRCAEIAESLDAGDLSLWREYEGRMSPEEKGVMWNMRQSQVERAAKTGSNATCFKRSQGLFGRALRAETESRFEDLDFWGDDAPMPPKRMPMPVPETDGDENVDDEILPPHDDDDDQQEMMPCPACRGLGRSKTGAVCSRCNGSGRVPVSDDVDDDDDELESRRYEIEFDED